MLDPDQVDSINQYNDLLTIYYYCCMIERGQPAVVEQVPLTVTV
jgi:hypothetical protein